MHFLLLLASTLFAAEMSTFDLMSLPKGKEVTLPRSMVTRIPVNQRSVMTATGVPQTLKITHEGDRTIQLAIYDQKAEGVRKLELKPGAPYLYPFADSIAIEPKSLHPAHRAVLIESDKPLSVSRQ